MSKRDKRLEAIRRHPNQVDFLDLKVALESCGFEGQRRGDASHWTFAHPLLPYIVPIAEPHSHGDVLPVYVRNALRALDDLETSAGGGEEDDDSATRFGQ
jgi:hypothetical protein